MGTSRDRGHTAAMRAHRGVLRTAETTVWRDPSVAPSREVGAASEPTGLWSSLSELRVEQKWESWLHLVLTLGAAVAVLQGVLGASFLVRHWRQFVDLVRQAF